MAPDTIRAVTEIRQEFYRRFADLMAVPVSINSEKAYGSTPSKVSWVDEQNHSNYICVYAHLAPDMLFPDRPLILRLAVNNGMEYMAAKSMSRTRAGLMRKIKVNVTLLPEEILAFLPWLSTLVSCSTSDFHQTLTEPPYPLSIENSAGLCHQAWTKRALMRFSQHLRHCEAISR
ncbi:hypothetical protein XM38_043080 [Halomicronema hongdechloris C2206]|uniref:Uncharacterized protein n=1 Tax=Halomicronema hongdechloris C2206 TaxID=1641165 RepID=A0A1Z3HSQ6_9CYAN|nr:hypothetical protein [Halomicronema hongdechloris]ASC73344.1 hypothetical protein XM38_043080 [Halomicronema hongdechloris C2206]